MIVEGAPHKHALNVFQSWGEMIDACEKDGGKFGNSSRHEGMRRWAGTDSWEECREIALNGWADGEAQIASLSAAILAKVTGLIEIEHVTYDVEGIGLDVATYLNGEPECWQKFDKEITEGEGSKHLRIVYNATVSGGVSANVITARGAALAALIQALEYAGTRVELWALPICTGQDFRTKSPGFEARVLVKAADQDLDMSRVAFALAHPSMLRRVGFALVEGHKGAGEEYAMGGGYGYPSPSHDQGDIYIAEANLGDAQWINPLAATKWVIETLKKQGVTINDK